MTNSRAKGARGEREVATIYRDAGFECARTSDGQAQKGRGDIAIVGVPGHHIEVKRGKSIRFWDAIEQADREAGDAIPAVHFRRDGDTTWRVIVPLDTYLSLIAPEVQ